MNRFMINGPTMCVCLAGTFCSAEHAKLPVPKEHWESAGHQRYVLLRRLFGERFTPQKILYFNRILRGWDHDGEDVVQSGITRCLMEY